MLQNIVENHNGARLMARVAILEAKGSVKPNPTGVSLSAAFLL